MSCESMPAQLKAGGKLLFVLVYYLGSKSTSSRQTEWQKCTILGENRQGLVPRLGRKDLNQIKDRLIEILWDH